MTIHHIFKLQLSMWPEGQPDTER